MRHTREQDSVAEHQELPNKVELLARNPVVVLILVGQLRGCSPPGCHSNLLHRFGCTPQGVSQHQCQLVCTTLCTILTRMLVQRHHHEVLDTTPLDALHPRLEHPVLAVRCDECIIGHCCAERQSKKLICELHTGGGTHPRQAPRR